MTRLPTAWDRDFLRSIRGQLGLLGLAYAGAVALAVVALCLRAWFFESYARERYPEASASLRAMIERAARGAPDRGTAEPLSPQEFDAVYGAWIGDPALDPEGHAARRLLWSNREPLLRRLRITAAAGNLSQRSRALDLLRSAEGSLPDEARALCRFLAERARRRGESVLVETAESVLSRPEQASESSPRPVDPAPEGVRSATPPAGAEQPLERRQP
jgi:hypothetical protein